MKTNDVLTAACAIQRTGSVTLCPDFSLPDELNKALEFGWMVQPVLATSRRFPCTALVGYPTSDPVQVRHWAQQYKCNWAVHTGHLSRLLVLEINLSSGSQSIRHLCQDDWYWRHNTLLFRDASRLFACFRFEGQHIYRFDSELPGLTVHCGSTILIPPSIYSDGDFLRYIGGKRILDLPDWLCNPPQLRHALDPEDWVAA